jgi:dephospho-CoA kinase
MTRKVSAIQMKKPLKKVIILTGPSGSGKSAVAAVLARKGFRWIKGDEIARSLYQPGKPVWRSIRRVFGPDVFRAGRVDRKKLGTLIFSSAIERKRLNKIVFPALLKQIRHLLSKAPKACVDMAVYFQAGSPPLGGPVVLVDAPLKLRVTRLMQRGLDPRRAQAQARALHFSKAERKRCDLILVNSGSLDALRQKMATALNYFF